GDVVENPADICALWPKMTGCRLVDSDNLCGYNVPSARFDPISASGHHKNPTPSALWFGYRTVAAKPTTHPASPGLHKFSLRRTDYS
ncbi:MAG: hypothetical protein IIX61_08485, partial [Loktanella sp.]|nr:hypothetical protein [Loktanella sp.]